MAASVAFPRGRRIVDLLQALLDSFGRLARSIDRQDGGSGVGPLPKVGPRLAGGRQLAELAEFVRDNNDRLIRLAALVCRNVTDAEDAVQAALERAWRNRAGLRDETLLKPWLDRIVVREAIRLTRSRESLLGRFLGRDRDEIVIEPLDQRATDTDLVAGLKIAFAALPADQRAVVALHLYQGYTVAETAEIVGAPVETARSRLRLARQKLRIELEDA